MVKDLDWLQKVAGSKLTEMYLFIYFFFSLEVSIIRLFRFETKKCRSLGEKNRFLFESVFIRMSDYETSACF